MIEATKHSPTSLPPTVPRIDTRAGIERVTVCTRPFRAQGPRVEAERLGDTLVLHNYGHGGSGWSLSWGSAQQVFALLRDAGIPLTQPVAVIGAGALGLTAALTLQSVGMPVTLYAREWPPVTRSSHATGSWTPDSRIALTSHVDATFVERWETMTRASFAAFQPYVERGDHVVEWTPRFVVSDTESDPVRAAFVRQDSHGFFHRISKLDRMTPALERIDAGLFGTRYAWQTRSLTFNVAILQQALLQQFQQAGGTTETREFASTQQLQGLPQKVVVHCTGYGARQLFGDESLVPVRGQIGWLAAQPGIDYGIHTATLNVLGRRDGIVVQPSPQGDDTGWNDASEAPDGELARRGLQELLALQAGMR